MLSTGSSVSTNDVLCLSDRAQQPTSQHNQKSSSIQAQPTPEKDDVRTSSSTKCATVNNTYESIAKSQYPLLSVSESIIGRSPKKDVYQYVQQLRTPHVKDSEKEICNVDYRQDSTEDRLFWWQLPRTKNSLRQYVDDDSVSSSETDMGLFTELGATINHGQLERSNKVENGPSPLDSIANYLTGHRLSSQTSDYTLQGTSVADLFDDDRDELAVIDGQTVVKDSNVDPILCRLKRQQVVAALRRKESSVATDMLEAERVRFNRSVSIREIDDQEWGELFTWLVSCCFCCYSKCCRLLSRNQLEHTEHPIHSILHKQPASYRDSVGELAEEKESSTL